MQVWRPIFKLNCDFSGLRHLLGTSKHWTNNCGRSKDDDSSVVQNQRRFRKIRLCLRRPLIPNATGPTGSTSHSSIATDPVSSTIGQCIIIMSSSLLPYSICELLSVSKWLYRRMCSSVYADKAFNEAKHLKAFCLEMSFDCLFSYLCTCSVSCLILKNNPET